MKGYNRLKVHFLSNLLPVLQNKHNFIYSDKIYNKEVANTVTWPQAVLLQIM